MQTLAAVFGDTELERDRDYQLLEDGKYVHVGSTPWAIQYYEDMQSLYNSDQGAELSE